MLNRLSYSFFLGVVIYWFTHYYSKYIKLNILQ